MLDFLQNKDGKALVLTSCSAIYLDLVRQRARWAVPLAGLIGVSSSGVLDPTRGPLHSNNLDAMCVACRALITWLHVLCIYGFVSMLEAACPCRLRCLPGPPAFTPACPISCCASNPSSTVARLV